MIHHTPQRGVAVAASPGIAIGIVQKINPGQSPIPEKEIDAGAVQEEIRRLEQAITDSVADLDTERLHLLNLESQEPLHILDAQRLMLLDTDLSHKVIHMIREKKINAEWALHQQIGTICEVFEHIEDSYLRARKTDIEQVGMRILHHLTGQEEKPIPLLADGEQIILVSDDFTPLEIMRFWRQGIAGFIAEQGGINAHGIIIARGIGLPALMGAENAIRHIEDGNPVILDGEQCLWIANPDDATLSEYQRFTQTMDLVQDGLQTYASQASVSADGHALRLMANLEVNDEVPLACEAGVDGVGLYRTEFLLAGMDCLPGEDEQFRHYTRVLHGMEGLPVVFRLIYIGGEKPMLFEHIIGHAAAGMNPSLGLRGIRILLRNPDVLRVQLMALLRAANEGEIQILVPMVTHSDEIIQVRCILNACARELGIKKMVPLGAMIEVPAAVMIADELAKVSDFFSVGTNDLIQYTLAADRADDEVAYLYNTSHPAIESMLRLTVRAAKKAGIPITMCGEMAADRKWTERLMNMGFDALSMSINHILPVRKHLSSLYYHPET